MSDNCCNDGSILLPPAPLADPFVDDPFCWWRAAHRTPIWFAPPVADQPDFIPLPPTPPIYVPLPHFILGVSLLGGTNVI